MTDESSHDRELNRLITLCEDVCRYLSMQRGMIPKDYAKDLAKQIELTRREIERPGANPDGTKDLGLSERTQDADHGRHNGKEIHHQPEQVLPNTSDAGEKWPSRIIQRRHNKVL